MIKTCKVCGKTYDGHFNSKYCSDECRKKSKRRCPTCKKLFEPKTHNQKYCSSECRNEEKKRYYREVYYPNNREMVLKCHEEYRTNNKEKCKEYNRKWKKDNPDKVKLYSIRQFEKHREDRKNRAKKWNRENPERHRENVRNWEKKNPDKVALYQERNNARKYAKRHNITLEYCENHNDCFNCPYPYDVCLFE